MNEEEIQIIDFAYLKMCAEHDYIYETGEAKLLLNYITNLQQENARLKDKIEKTIEHIKKLDDNTDDTTCYDIDKYVKEDLLNILKEN